MLPALLVLITLGLRCSRAYNDFPSLITANATMAVIVDHGFFDDLDDYRQALNLIPELITEVTRKNMRMSEVAFTIFETTNINLGRDYTVLLSIAECASTWSLFEQAHREKIVHLALTDPDCPRLPEGSGISLPMILPGEELPQIFLDLRMSKTLTWPKVNVIHDDTFARDTISRVVKALSVELPDTRLSLAARTLFSTKFERNEGVMRRRIYDILSNYRVDLLGSCFMLIINMDLVSTVMEVATTLQMVHPTSQWLFVMSEGASRTSNVTSFIDLLSEGENVAFVYNATDLGPDCIMGLACHIKELMGALATSLENSLLSEIELYDHVTEEEFEVVRLSKAERKQEIIKSMNKELAFARSSSESSCGECINWRITSAITWGTSFEQSQDNSHESDRRGHGKLMEAGVWSPSPGVHMTEPLFPHIVHGFRGINLPLSSFHNPPWQIIKYSKSGTREYGGLIFDVVNQLSANLNFTYTVQLPSGFEASHSVHEVPNDNSSRSQGFEVAAISVAQKIPKEIVDLVRLKKVFLVAVASTILENAHGVNFTSLIAEQTYGLLSARPESLTRVFLFVAPFGGDVWICLIVSLIIVGPILYLMVKLSPMPVGENDYHTLNSTWYCSWYVYGALLQQAGTSLPKPDSARLIVGTWWLVVMVVVATYSGNLIAFLTFPRMDAPIDSIDDLLERSDEFNWTIPNGSALESYLAAAAIHESKYKTLLEGAGRQDPSKPEEAVESIKTNRLVLIDWRSSLAFLMRTDLIKTGGCHFHISAQEFMTENLGMMIAGDSPYITLVNNAIERMHESGLIKKWTDEKMPMRDKCWEVMNMNQEATNHKVSMGDMQGIFFVLAIGFTGAAVIIAFEYFWHRRKLLYQKNFIRPFVT